MAQEDAVSKAKGVLAGANKLSSEADPTGSMKKTVAPNAMPKAKSASAPAAGTMDNGGPADNRAAITAEGAKYGMKGVPIMHDGGMVKKTGPAILEKGEKVVPKEKAMKNADLGKMAGAKKDGGEAKHESKGKAKHKHTHIEHHDDGTHTVRHTPKGGGEEVSYSKPDLDGVIDGLHQNIGGGAPALGAGPAMGGADMGGGAPAAGAPAAGAPPAGAGPAGI